MLKWTVMNKREANEKSDPSRHLTATPCTTLKSRESISSCKAKRRRSCTSARSSNSRRMSAHNRNSLPLDRDKENQFTSTPIKSLEEHNQLDVLRDVSNLTPNETATRRYFPKCNTTKTTGEHPVCQDLTENHKHKKKKRCVDPAHSQESFFNKLDVSTNFFRPFETVDSHIESLVIKQKRCSCGNTAANQISPKRDNIIPFTTNLSPCTSSRKVFNYGTSPKFRKPPPMRTGGLNLEEFYPPSKRARIDHVNDFLQRISCVTSPEEDEEYTFPRLNSNRNIEISYNTEETKLTPLVKRLVDLRFSKISYKRENEVNDSSFINDLSLDQIVDAILDTSDESSDKNTNTVIVQEQLQERDNNLNETHEENLINSEHEKHAMAMKTSFDKNSPDSGFRSTSTENSHYIDSNYVCKCNNNNNGGLVSKQETINSVTEKTIINLSETYNERCVDVNISGRKRASSSPTDCDSNFTLKRQKCVRRRKLLETREVKTENEIVQSHCELNMESTFPHTDNALLNDNSYTSSVMSANSIAERTPMQSGDATGTSCHSSCTETPQETFKNIRRTRRCLLFDSPKGEEDLDAVSSSTPTSEERDGQGTIDLNIQYESGKLMVNVIRCRDLHRPNGKQINAYVKTLFLCSVSQPNSLRVCEWKVTLQDKHNDSQRSKRRILYRTPVQGDSCNPAFNHTFKIHTDKTDLQKKILVEVWHRNRATRRSEFLGCTSFAVKNAAKKDISGTYRLLSQSRGRCQSAPLAAAVDSVSQQTPSYSRNPTMCESQSSAEEIISFEELENDLKKSTSKAALSQQQKDADENLFLRYLELDPTEGPDAIPAATQRKATGNKYGRTPFTTTKKLTRAPKSGFGFSVVWTHPPRIERVEKGLPADRAGILPGDYIIFVDKHNVVLMPEIDILNLIRSYGNQLTLEVFRRRSASRNGSVPSVLRINSTGTGSTTGLHVPSNVPQRRPSTVCSINTASVDYNRKKLHLPQVTFSAEKAGATPEEARRKAIYQLIGKEQQYATALQFAVSRFVAALAERKDLITPSEHRILFQNSEEILRITEEILENIVQEDGDVLIHAVARTYLAKLGEITSAYKRYCSGIKKADCVLANKTKNSNSDFVRFLQNPTIPRRRPDITVFIHKPLEHFREILKLLNVILGQTKFNHEDYPVINQIVHDWQAAYREMTTEAGLMEPMGSGRPLLSVQDLESRLVFTKCKPFVLSKPGRHWIFGGDLGRVEGRNVRQYWTLLFNDLLLFAKVSRDRVLFVIEEPIPLLNISELCFNIRKKATEFRIIVQPGGKSAASPTVHCGPDLSRRTPKKNANKRTIALRAPTLELKAMWQNLLQRQIFHINSGMDGSSFSSPLESPDAPITSSVVTLQSAESLSFRRQNSQPQYINVCENPDYQKQLDALIEHKCKRLSKSSSGTKGSAIHLEQWMKGQLGRDQIDDIDIEPEPEIWSMEMFRKRSEELFDAKNDKRNESRCEEWVFSDQDKSPSKSTTSESQVTVRSSPIAPETVPVCRDCHKRCLANSNCIKEKINTVNNNTRYKINSDREENPWQASSECNNHCKADTIEIDPFSSLPPQISVIPATPESSTKTSSNPETWKGQICNCQTSSPRINKLDLNHEFDISPDDSPQNEEHPYHSLSNSNVTLRRYGTVSSLERLTADELQDEYDEIRNSSGSDEETQEEERGFDNEAYSHTTLRNWTTRAGSFVIEKMAFFERYLKASENHINGEDIQEDETSGATSGEEIWGTPTSGGEMEDPLNSCNYDGRFSPNDGSLSSENDENTELMMDELLMTPPISSSTIRGLLPRRTLEPLMEEEYSDSCSTSSTQTETSPSPEQGNGTGDVADTCSTAVENSSETKNTSQSNSTKTETSACISKIHRSDSYRQIIEAAEDSTISTNFITHFKPAVQFVNIERIERRKGTRIFQFFNVRQKRRVYETFPEGRHLIKLFSKENTIYPKEIPTLCAEKPVSPQRLKDKQLDRRFWKQLSKRRGNKSPNLPRCVSNE